MIEKSNLNSHGIYHYVYNDDIYNIKVLMIGPSDTPMNLDFIFLIL